MKKRWFICLLAIVLLLFSFSITAMASGGGLTVTITTTNKSLVIEQENGTVSFDISIKASNNTGKLIGNLEFTVEPPEGFTISNAQTSYSPAQGGASFTQSDGNNFKYVYNNTTGDSFSGEPVIATATVTVANTAASESKSYEIKITGLEESSDKDSQDITTNPVGLSGITVKHGDNAHTWGEPVEEPKATCTTQGTNTYTCNVCQATKTEQTKALGHNWEEEGAKTFTWQSGFFDSGSVDGKSIPTATYKVICQREECDFHTTGSEQTAKVEEKNRKDPTCERTGSVDYEATVTLDGKTYTDTTSHKGVTIKATGHKWSDMTVVWEPNDGSKKPTKATATVTCANDNCEWKTESKVVEEAQIQESGQDPTCTKTGNKTYTANFTFEHGATGGEKSLVIETVPATGHDWDVGNIEWTWSPTSSEDVSNAKAVVKCKHKNCDGGESGYYSEGLQMDVTVTQKEVTKAATCDQDGTATYTATASHKDVNNGTKYTEERSNVKLAMTGHNYANPEVVWSGSDSDNYTGTKIKWTCTKDTSHTKEVNAEVTSDTQQATYESAGKTTWTAKVTSDKLSDVSEPDKIEPKEFSATQEKVLPMLEATANPPTVAPEADQTQATKDALKNDVLKQVEDALVNDKPGSLSQELVTALRGAGNGNQAGMTVDTQLVVTDNTGSKGEVTGVDKTNVKKYYDIHIDVTVNNGGLSQVKGTVSEVSTPIEFTVPKGEGDGPIFYVMTDHGNSWNKIDSKVVGSNIVFSSKQFSHFAVISSNNIADADVDPLPSVTYNGSAFTPKPKVTINGGQELKEGVDYDLEYKNNTNVGTATVVIKAHDSNDLGLTGTKEVTFSIVQAPSKGGSGSGGSNAKDAPDTGDNTPLALYAVLVVLSATALTAAVLVLRRKHSGK